MMRAGFSWVNGVEGPKQRADTVRMAGCEKRTGEEGANQRDVSKRKKTNRNLIINKGEKGIKNQDSAKIFTLGDLNFLYSRTMKEHNPDL